MLRFWIEWNKKSENKRRLIQVYQEVYKNWEAYHVMYQRESFRLFQLDVWATVKNSVELPVDRSMIQTYAGALEEFNRALEDFQAFEKWYAADLAHKTKENAQMLHSKKGAVAEQFKRLEPLITPVKEGLRAALVEKKILK